MKQMLQIKFNEYYFFFNYFFIPYVCLKANLFVIAVIHVLSLLFIDELSTENRYTVKIARSQTIAYATECSESYQRNCCGSSRGFIMRLYDTTQKEILFFKRRLACGYCAFCCYLQVSN